MDKLLLSGLIIVFITSCQKYPEKEVAEIKNTLDSLKTKEVYYVYQDEFIDIQDSVNIVLVRLEEEKSRINGRKFDVYKLQLQNLINEIHQLIELGQTKTEVSDITFIDAGPEREE